MLIQLIKFVKTLITPDNVTDIQFERENGNVKAIKIILK
jgi:hypothetical protein